MIPKGMAIYNELTTMRTEVKTKPLWVEGTTSPKPTVVMVEITSHAA